MGSILNRGDICNLARRMKERKDAGEEPMILLLGAGASIESGSPSMQQLIGYVLSEHKVENWRVLSPKEQIAEFYNLIDKYSASQLQDLFAKYFPKNAPPSSGYENLAQLIKGEYLRLVFSTNVDGCLERQLERLGMSLIDDIVTIDATAKNKEECERIVRDFHNANSKPKILNLHGLLAKKTARFTLSDTARFFPKLENLVKGILNKPQNEIIIVGHSLSDMDLMHCLKPNRGAIWYVNPESPDLSQIPGRLIASRPGSFYIDEAPGRFDHFFTQLLTSLYQDDEHLRDAYQPEFQNRERELARLLEMVTDSDSPMSLILLEAPSGFGKTHLLDRAEQKLKNWKRVRVDFKKNPEMGTSKHELVDHILEQLGSPGIGADQDDQAIFQQITRAILEPGNSQKKILLIFDECSRLSSEILRWLPNLNDGLKKRLCTANCEFRMILAGRYLRPKFGQDADLPRESLHLSEFDERVIKNWVNEIVQRDVPDFAPKNVEIIARYILQLTGGHPRCIVNVLSEIRKEHGGLILDKTDLGYYFSVQQCETLFRDRVDQELDQIRQEIETETKSLESIRVLSIFRHLNDKIIDQVCRDILGIRDATHLISGMIRSSLMEPPKRDMIFWNDQIIRRMFVAEMKYTEKLRERYRALSVQAAEIYLKLMQNDCKRRGNDPHDSLDNYIIDYAMESLYHKFEALSWELDQIRMTKGLIAWTRQLVGEMRAFRPPIRRTLKAALCDDLADDPFWKEVVERLGETNAAKVLSIVR